MPPHAAPDEAETDEESETEEEDIDQWLGADEVRRGRLEREADMVMKALSRRYGAGAERRGVILELARRELAKKSKYDAIHESRQRALNDAGEFGENALGLFESSDVMSGVHSACLLVSGNFSPFTWRLSMIESVKEFRMITSNAKEAVVRRPRWGQLGRDLASLAHALNEWCDLEVGPIADDAIHVSTWARFSDAARATLGRGGRGAVAAIVVMEGGPYSVSNVQEQHIEPGTLFVCTEHSFRFGDWRRKYLDKSPSTYACAVFRRVSAAPVQAENEARWWGPGGERHAMGFGFSRPWYEDLSRCKSWQQEGAEMEDSGFALMRCALPRKILDVYRCHLRGVVGMQRTIGRGSAEPHRTLLRDEPGANEIHRHLTPLLQFVSTDIYSLEMLKPSYCIVATYPRGASLPKHVDRPQCAFTLSVLVDYDGLADGDDAPWPLELDLADGTTHAATWGAGDGLLYRGADLPHARGPLPTASATYLFFHWVLPSHKGRLR